MVGSAWIGRSSESFADSVVRRGGVSVVVDCVAGTVVVVSSGVDIAGRGVANVV